MISAARGGQIRASAVATIGAATGEFARPTAQNMFHFVKQPTLR